jgi:esterase/lipase superfamily enzyme
MGRFFDYEARGMIDAVAHKYENGELQAFCVDSVDAESWYNKAALPSERAHRHTEYDRYLVDEAVPFIRSRNASDQLIATGCSMTMKDIPHWLDVWGDGAGHDWPWWQQMAVKFL